MRVVLDVNILVSALLSRSGSPARLLRAWIDGSFELVVSVQLLGELERALGYPKISSQIDPVQAVRVVEWLTAAAPLAADPPDGPSVRSRDSGNDYLIALAESTRAVLVTGDQDLLALAGRIPVFTAAEFLASLEAD